MNDFLGNSFYFNRILGYFTLTKPASVIYYYLRLVKKNYFHYAHIDLIYHEFILLFIYCTMLKKLFHGYLLGVVISGSTAPVRTVNLNSFKMSDPKL